MACPDAGEPLLQRRPVEPGCDAEGADGGRTVAGPPQGDARSVLEVCGRPPGRLCELEGRRVMVCEQLGVIVLAAEGLDPLRGGNVLLRS